MRRVILLFTFIAAATRAFAQLPTLVQDIAPGSRHGFPAYMVQWRGIMYFTAYDSAHGYELWSYDEKGPAKLALDFNPGPGDGVGELGIYQDKLIFAGNLGLGYEVYSYDGIKRPEQLTTVSLGAGTSAPHNFTVTGNTLYFAATHHRPDGRRMTDLFSYDGTDTPRYYAPMLSSSYGLMPEWLIAFNNKLYFSGAVTTLGPIRKIHQLDPATGNIRILDHVAQTSDLFYQPFQPTILGSKLYFTGYQIRHSSAANGDSTVVFAELHCLDGDSIRQLTSLTPGKRYPGTKSRIGTFQGKIYFGGCNSDSTVQLHSYDPATTVIAKECSNSLTVAGALVGGFADFNSELYFVNYTPASGYEIWDFSNEHCGMTLDIFKGKGSGVFTDPSFFKYNGHLYFRATDSVHGTELWRIGTVSTGISNVSWDGSAVVAPNPTQSDASLQIELSENERLQVTITDAHGRLVLETGTLAFKAGSNQLKLPMQGWASGIYFYQLRDATNRKMAGGRIVRR